MVAAAENLQEPSLPEAAAAENLQEPSLPEAAAVEIRQEPSRPEAAAAEIRQEPSRPEVAAVEIRQEPSLPEAAAVEIRQEPSLPEAVEAEIPTATGLVERAAGSLNPAAALGASGPEIPERTDHWLPVGDETQKHRNLPAVVEAEIRVPRDSSAPRTREEPTKVAQGMPESKATRLWNQAPESVVDRSVPEPGVAVPADSRDRPDSWLNQSCWRSSANPKAREPMVAVQAHSPGDQPSAKRTLP